MTTKKKAASSSAVHPPDVFAIMADTMIEFRKEMEHYDSIGVRIAARTRFIMRAVFGILLLSSVYLVYMILLMSSNMTVMTTHLEDMYSSFGGMSEDMQKITRSVELMGNSISGMPVIAESMYLINRDVGAMTGSVYEINLNISAVDANMVRINADMREMTGRLSNMSRSVNLMKYDVREMSLPINSGPFSGFWPK